MPAALPPGQASPFNGPLPLNVPAALPPGQASPFNGPLPLNVPAALPPGQANPFEGRLTLNVPAARRGTSSRSFRAESDDSADDLAGPESPSPRVSGADLGVDKETRQ